MCRSFHMFFVDHPESSARKFYPKKPLNQDPKTTGNHLVSHGVPVPAVVENPCVFRGFFPQGVSTTSQFLLHAGGRGSVWLEVRIWSSHVFWVRGPLMIDVEGMKCLKSSGGDQTSYMVGLLDRCEKWMTRYLRQPFLCSYCFLQTHPKIVRVKVQGYCNLPV